MNIMTTNDKRQKVWFTADTHFRHKNVLKYCSGRAEAGGYAADDIGAHDNWLIDKWNSTIGKQDTVYIIGDVSFANQEDSRKIIERLNGRKHLIVGNHDASAQKLNNYFKLITQMEMKVFKASTYNFLEEDFNVFMCHYPMVTWPSKHYGCVDVHGHCHGNLDDYNDTSTDLRVDVGLDGRLAEYGFVSLEKLYAFFKKKTEGLPLSEYALAKKTEMII